MPLKGAAYVGLVVAGAVAGVLSSGPFRNHEHVNAPEAKTFLGTSVASQDEDVQILRAQYARQIEQLKSENEELQKRLSEAAATGAARPLTPDEQRARTTELIKKMEADKKQRAVGMLLAAGYSPDEIEWLRARLEDLEKERALDQRERRARDLPTDPVKQLARLYDKDIELRYEIGDDEYERFLQALGRPTNVPVMEVLSGSGADSAGIRTGDIILDYDNKRLFNPGELDGLAMGTNGRSVTVTVNRGGEILKLSVPGGPIGVKSRNSSIDNSVAVRP